jgi:hypothetical protein
MPIGSSDGQSYDSMTHLMLGIPNTPEDHPDFAKYRNPDKQSTLNTASKDQTPTEQPQSDEPKVLASDPMGLTEFLGPILQQAYKTGKAIINKEDLPPPLMDAAKNPESMAEMFAGMNLGGVRGVRQSSELDIARTTSKAVNDNTEPNFYNNNDPYMIGSKYQDAEIEQWWKALKEKVEENKNKPRLATDNPNPTPAKTELEKFGDMFKETKEAPPEEPQNFLDALEERIKKYENPSQEPQARPRDKVPGWDKEKLDQFSMAVRQGLSDDTLASYFGVTPEAAKGIRNTLKNHKTDYEIKLAVQQDKSHEQVAKELGIPTKMVERYRKEMGVDRRDFGGGSRSKKIKENNERLNKPD